MAPIRFRGARAATLGGLLAFAATGGVWAQGMAGLKPLERQPAATDLVTGLSVTYYYSIFNDVDEISQWAKYEKGEVGRPLPVLDYKVGAGEVLSSSQADGVGADIRGLIRFEEPGTYAFAALSNDGVRVNIGGKRVINDPLVHSDQYSDTVEVAIAEAGWYQISILYYEKRNTSTLKLFWLRPGDAAGSLNLVPAEALAHIRK